MSLSTGTTQGGSGHSTPASGAAAAGAPLLAGAAGDRCTKCNARLAIDQRYCVECGTRRGNPRFTLAQPTPQSGAAATAGQVASAAVTRLQLLLALVIVLVALGLGVLIGNGSSKTPRVVVNGSVSQTSAPKSGSSGSTTTTGSSTSSGGQPFSSGG